MKSKFITIEGTEGVGKSTNVAFVREWISARQIPLVVTREPGGTPLAEEIRGMLLSRREELMNPTAELLLAFAARAQHLDKVIKPALAEGKWVLSDRFTDSTYAYQGAGRGLDKDLILTLENIVQGDLRPDLTILLDIDVSIGLERARQRGELDRFEVETIAFFEKVRAGYHERVSADPDRFAIIDVSVPLENVKQQIHAVLKRHLVF